MVEEGVNPSCVFYVDVDEPPFFCGGFEWWKFITLEKSHGFLISIFTRQ
jgi:hypothetical protein